MARNSTLGSVRSMVKAETGRTLLASSTQEDNMLNQVIFDIQQWLGSNYDWPFLQSRWTVAVNTRYTTFPPTNDVALTCSINHERPVKTFIKWNNVWQVVDYGIGEIEEFNYIDSDRNLTLNPVQRWQFSDETQFEIWPIPSSVQTFRFVGQRSLTELRVTPVTAPPTWDDTKTLDLDDILVAHYASAELYARAEDKEAYSTSLSLARQRESQVRAVYPTRTQPCIIGGNGLDRRMLRVVPLVVVAGS